MTINEMKQSYKQSYTDNVELSIFNCGHEPCLSGHTWGPGVRDHYLIHLVVAGKGVYQVNGASYTLQAGDLFLAKPNQLITYAADETDPWEYYWVGFNGACANKLVVFGQAAKEPAACVFLVFSIANPTKNANSFCAAFMDF